MSKVIELNNAHYVLRQSGRAWNSKLDSVLISFGLIQSKDEPCLYKKNENVNTVLIIVSIDDLIIACSSKMELNDVKQK